MGTHSLTHVIETYTDNKGKQKKLTIATIYRQMDGYPSGMGKDLAEFLATGKMVNGLSGQPGRVFNGVGCMAAQLVKHLKDDAGSIYLYPPKSKGCGEDYTYEITCDFDEKVIRMKCFEAHWKTDV